MKIIGILCLGFCRESKHRLSKKKTSHWISEREKTSKLWRATPPVTVATRSTTLLVGDAYEPSIATGTGRGFVSQSVLPYKPGTIYREPRMAFRFYECPAAQKTRAEISKQKQLQ